MIDRPYRLSLRATQLGQTITVLVKGAQLVGRSDADTNYAPDIDLKSFGAWNAGVSRRHLVMNPFEDDAFFVKDLGSANGTRINGELLKSGMVYSLHSGDELRVGTLNLVVMFWPATTDEIEAYEHPTVEFGQNTGSISNQERIDAVEQRFAHQLTDESVDRNATIYQRRTLRIVEELLQEKEKADARGREAEDDRICMTPDERDAVALLREFVHTSELGENILFYIARDAVHNPYWRVNRRIAVLQSAADYGYIAKDNPELVQEEHRRNKMRSGGR
jgi:hypothetical protein